MGSGIRHTRVIVPTRDELVKERPWGLWGPVVAPIRLLPDETSERVRLTFKQQVERLCCRVPRYGRGCDSQCPASPQGSLFL